MKTKISAKFVIGFDGSDHVIFKDGELVFEKNIILFVGHNYPHPVDQTIDAGNAIISPGFIDLHSLGDIDHALLNLWVPPAVRNGLEWSEEYFHTGRHEVFTRDEVLLNRQYALAQLILNGITTSMPVAGEYHREWSETYEEFEDIVDIAADLGLRVYLGPNYRSGVTVTRINGLTDVMWNEKKGRDGLKHAIRFVERFGGTRSGLIEAFLAPCRIQTCSLDLLKRTKQASERLNCLVRLPACQSWTEILLLRKWYDQTPLQLLSDLNFTGVHTLIPHAIFIGGHHSLMPSDRDELELIVSTGTKVIHCPLFEARLGLTMNSFDQYTSAGVSLAMGTDTFPPDMIRGMDIGCSINKIIEGTSSVSQPIDFYRAATMGGARALGREDLGRLAPGAKADLFILDLSNIRTGTVDDPIRTMVNNTTSNCIRTVIIDGRIVMLDGKIPGVDLDNLRDCGQICFEKMKHAYVERDYMHRPEKALFPPSTSIIEKP